MIKCTEIRDGKLCMHIISELPSRIRPRIVDKDGADLEPELDASFCGYEILGVQDHYAFLAAHLKLSRSEMLRIRAPLYHADYCFSESRLEGADIMEFIDHLVDERCIPQAERGELSDLLGLGKRRRAPGNEIAGMNRAAAFAIEAARRNLYWVTAMRDIGGRLAYVPSREFAQEQFDAAKHCGLIWMEPAHYRSVFGGDPGRLRGSMDGLFSSIRAYENGSWKLNMLHAVPVSLKIDETAWQARDHGWMPIYGPIWSDDMAHILDDINHRNVEAYIEECGIGNYDSRFLSNGAFGGRRYRNIVTGSFQINRDPRLDPERRDMCARFGEPVEMRISGRKGLVRIKAMDSETGNLEWAIQCATGDIWYDCHCIREEVMCELACNEIAELEYDECEILAAKGKAIGKLKGRQFQIADA